jgi:hypothetical protein
MIETQEDRIFTNNVGSIKPHLWLIAKMTALTQGTKGIQASLSFYATEERNFYILLQANMGRQASKKYEMFEADWGEEGDLREPEVALFFERADAIYAKYREAQRLVDEAREAKIKSGEIVTKKEQK